MRTAGKVFNDKIDKLLRNEPLSMNRCAADYGVYIWLYDDTYVVIMNLSTDDFLIATRNEVARKLIEDTITQYYTIKVVNERMFHYLNWRIIQSDKAISINQTEHIQKLLLEYFPERPRPCHIPFRTDHDIEEEIFNSKICSDHELIELEKQYGASFSHTYGQVLHVSVSSRLDLGYSMARLGHFQTIRCKLGFECLRRVLRYLYLHSNKPLIFPKLVKRDSTTHIRAFWSKKEYEDIDFSNKLAGHQDSGFANDKVLRSSFGGIIHTLLGTAINWKVKKLLLPVNSTDAEVRILYFSLLMTKQIRNLLIAMGFPVGKAAPHYEDNVAASNLVHAHRLTPRLKHIDLPLCLLHHENNLDTFTIIQQPSRFMLPDILIKSHSGPSLLRMLSWSMGHVHLASLPSWHLEELSKPAPISTLPHFLPKGFSTRPSVSG